MAGMVVIVHLFCRHFRRAKLCFKLWKGHHRFFPVVFWGSAVVEFLSARGLLQSPWRRILIDFFFHLIISLTPYQIIPIPYHQWRSMKGGYCIISNSPNLLIRSPDMPTFLQFLSSDLFDFGHWLFSQLPWEKDYFEFHCLFVAGQKLGGGFKYVLYSPLFGEDSRFDSYFFSWVESTNHKRLFSLQ